MTIKAKDLKVGDIVTDDAYPEGPIKITSVRLDSFAVRIDGIRLNDGVEVWYLMGTEADIAINYNAGGE